MQAASMSMHTTLICGEASVEAGSVVVALKSAIGGWLS